MNRENIDDVVAVAALMLDVSPEEVRELPISAVTEYFRAYNAFMNLHAALGGTILLRHALRRGSPPGAWDDGARDVLIKKN